MKTTTKLAMTMTAMLIVTATNNCDYANGATIANGLLAVYAINLLLQIRKAHGKRTDSPHPAHQPPAAGPRHS